MREDVLRLLLKSSKNIVFEHNVADDNMTLYIPVKGQTELKKLSIPNNTEDAVYELTDKKRLRLS